MVPIQHLPRQTTVDGVFHGIHVMRLLGLALICMTCLLCSCVGELESVISPRVNTDSVLAITTPIDSGSQSILSGIYIVDSPSDRFGDTVAVQCRASVVTIFTVKGVAYFSLRGGHKGDSVLLA